MREGERGESEKQKNNLKSQVTATLRLYLYNLTSAGLQIILAIATRLELYFMDLVNKIATWRVLHTPMLTLYSLCSNLFVLFEKSNIKLSLNKFISFFIK